MKTLLPFIMILAGCSQNNSTSSNENMVKDKIWKTYEYKKNGTPDPVIVAQEPSFQFRSDSKVYFTQINPVFRDTFNYQFVNNDNIKLTKTWAGSTYIVNFKIDRLTENDFDFTGTNSQTSTVHTYKTTKQ